jgi:hypothetical protein
VPLRNGRLGKGVWVTAREGLNGTFGVCVDN